MTCEDASGSVELDAPCTAGSIYLEQGLPDIDAVTLALPIYGLEVTLLPQTNRSRAPIRLGDVSKLHGSPSREMMWC